MTNFETENFNVRSSDNGSIGGHAVKSIHQELTNEEFKKHLQNRIKPDVCIRDQDGFITCGPIVGYERPEPIFKPRFDKPHDIEKFPRNQIDKLSPQDEPKRTINLNEIVPQKGK